MNTSKAKLDEIVEAGKPVGLKTSLGYIGGNHKKQNIDDINKFGSLDDVFKRTNMTSADKNKLINMYKPRIPPIVCSYCTIIGHV